jgi:hypothetical protein
LLVGAAVLAILVGFASGPPKELVQRNDHGGLAAWYQENASENRMQAEEMRQMAQYYEKYTPNQANSQTSSSIVRIWWTNTKPAEEFDALAKFHAEPGKTQ